MFQESSETNWEDAYRGLVAELESKERRWTNVETDLRQAALQLSIAAMGQSAELDLVLDRIVDIARDATDLLAPEIDALIAVLKRSERAKTTAATSDPAGSGTTSDTATGAQAQTIAPGAGVAAPAAQTHNATESLLDLRLIVQALTRRLAKVPDLADVAEQIERQSGNPDWSAALSNVADSIAQVVSSLNAERRELEEFLANVTAQLAEFEKWSQWHLSDTQQRRSDNEDFEQSVASQMENLHAEVESTEDIRHLKSAVQSRLSTVAEHLRAFRENETRRLNEAEARNAALAGEVSRLQRRTTELSEICGDQHDRLMVDALTRVHSRYAYEERLQQAFERWRDDGTALAFTLWDIDRFKAINDNYGHDAGDRLLRRIGRIFNKHRRREDFIARIGGEEFVLLLPETDIELAFGVADRLRETIAGTPFNYRGTRQQITISCGITQLREGDTPLSIYKRADQALYEAKATGRNRCSRA